MKFELHSEFQPTGDQPKAIRELADGFRAGNQSGTLVDVTGSDKTFTMANVIQELQKPTLIISHNKTLVAQFYNETKEFFPNNAVKYFVSYYDYYQPEAYMPQTDIYIEKDAAANEEIDRPRNSATSALLEREDVIVVVNVSCIYGLGNPIDYKNMIVSLRPGQEKDRDEVIAELISIQYDRNDLNFHRGTFRVRGDVIEIFPADQDKLAYRIELFDDEIDKITETGVLTSNPLAEILYISIYPANHYMVPREKIERAAREILTECENYVKLLKNEDKLLETQRIEERTHYDVEMLRETGFCSGIENYTHFLTKQKPGEPPSTLTDYFPKDFLTIVDENHITIPQIGDMFNGNFTRKSTLVKYGLHLPSSMDNRPLDFAEFGERMNQMLSVSATPNRYETEHKSLRAEQLIYPTGLLNPEISVRPVGGQIGDLLCEINKEIEKKNKILVMTLTKRMAEDLTTYLREIGIHVRYLHSDIDTLERAQIVRVISLDEFDVLVGINLLCEGLDIPEISPVAILNADKEGFLRSEISFMQTTGRAARNAEGHVTMYADNMTDSMRRVISETERCHTVQKAYNKVHGITPTTIKKAVRDVIMLTKAVITDEKTWEKDPELMSDAELRCLSKELEEKMRQAAAELNFEEAARLRDRVRGVLRLRSDPGSREKATEVQRAAQARYEKPAKHKRNKRG